MAKVVYRSVPTWDSEDGKDCMKKRYLRSGVEHFLCATTALIMLLILMIDSFELKAIPVLLLMMSIVIVNLLILKKYGKGIWLDGKY